MVVYFVQECTMDQKYASILQHSIYLYNIHIYIFDTCKKIETQNFTCPKFDQNFKEKVCDVRDVSDTYMYIQTHTCIATSYRMVQNHKYFLVCYFGMKRFLENPVFRCPKPKHLEFWTANTTYSGLFRGYRFGIKLASSNTFLRNPS